MKTISKQIQFLALLIIEIFNSLIGKKQKTEVGFIVHLKLNNSIEVKGTNLMISGKEGQRAESTEDLKAYATINGEQVERPVEDGSVEWSSSDTDVMEVTEDPTNEKRFSILLKPTTTTKVAFVVAKADADLGDGVVTIEGNVLTVENTPKLAEGFFDMAITPFHD